MINIARILNCSLEDFLDKSSTNKHSARRILSEAEAIAILRAFPDEKLFTAAKLIATLK